MSFTTSLESSPLSTNRAATPFDFSASDRFSISSNALRGLLAGPGGTRDGRAYLVNSLRRSVSPGSPSIVVVVMFCLNLAKRGSRSLIFPLTSSNSCGRLCQVCVASINSSNTL